MAAMRIVVWIATCIYSTNGVTFRSRTQQKQSPPNVDVSQCPNAFREPPSSCAAERVGARTSNETQIVITMFTMYPSATELVRQLEYHFLLGADHAILYDNGCPSESDEAKRSCDALEYALRPYINQGLVEFSTEYQCVKADDIMPEKNPIGGSGLALQLVAKTPSLHPKPGTMMVSLDDDEYIVMNDENQDLRHLRSMLLNSDLKTARVKWRLYGSSGHVCQPTGSLLRHFTHTIKPERAATDEEKEEASKEAKENMLNPPYTTHSGKFVIIWESVDQISKCDTHMCGPQHKFAYGDGRGIQASPGPSTQMAFIAHFAYQSEQHWAAKCARHAVPEILHRTGTVPKRYNEVTETKGWTNLLKKIGDVDDKGLHSCMADMFNISSETDPRQ